MTLRCRHRGPGAGGGGTAAEAGRGAEVRVYGGRRSKDSATAPVGDSGKPQRHPALFRSDRSWGSELSFSGQSGERGGGAVGRWLTPGRNGLSFGARGVFTAPQLLRPGYPPRGILSLR